MREHKVVVLGGMGSGKSTLVRSIAAGAVIDTDVANSDRFGADKASTTVALDYADIGLPNGERLRLYGTPGQQRFDFLWPILLQGARGAVLLLDARRAGIASELQDYLQVLQPFASSLALVVAVTHLDQAPQAALDDWATHACLDDQPLPLLAVDARDREQGLLLMDVLMSEMEAHALVAAYG
ncbi:GTP-binding protein [Stenotrophomonas maltophilia group sp. P373]|uniref:ATP/GTP-binding protein n=2 Tax=Gammaproteobacteria TaxID=1236 RepID=A0ABQ6QBY1_9GAMM|nr:MULTISPECIES: ATP/GTP-binding protein [Stenotrophomonas]GMR27694.1 ATP/GTP-binding protein [Stenotrophomonas sepilia]AYA92154.1 GTPase [Stenotrophomonas sp. Pemsol]MCU1004224.1 ATP/GTP-binding protein [Stenotrophomonas maltophilia]PZS94731.1 GTPase [Stenotrophomonas maltophilia]PZT17077.1 GTPase [Stenotrophomonas maltophilia]